MQLKQYAVVFIALLFGLETTIAIPRFRAVEVLSSRSLSSIDDTKPLPTTSDVQELYFTQYLDHFQHQDTRTWQQRYFYSDRYVRKYDDDSVKETRRQAKMEADAAEYTFLCVGGEGPPLDASVLIDSVHCSGDMLYTAQYLHETWNVNIHLYALEHRFYGTSQPFSDNYYYTNDKLRYLSSDQALHDAAYFLQQQMPNATVVTFGASYPGYLSALLRLKFPHLVSAAVSSSAPVQATLNMISYNDAVGANLQNEQLGGSSACYDVFVEGHAQLNHLVLQPDYHGLLATEFQLCDVDSLLETKNVQLFLGDGVIQWDVQGNDPACTDEFCNIAKVCDVLVSRAVQGAEWSALAWLSRTMRLQSSRESDCIVLDWNETLHQLSQPDEDWRSWLWQTCTEVGYYQTCLPDTKCPYGRGWHPLEQDLEICRVAFNITNVGDNVDATNNRYGGYDMSATRVLSVTGTEDPWTTLAFRPEHPPPNHQPFHSVPGASHHYWTHPPKGTDDIHIQRARQVILEQVMNWLGFDMKRKEDSAVATER